MKIKQIALINMLFWGVCLGQSAPLRPSTNLPDAEFPRINSDLSATFRVQAEHALKVQLLMELGQSTYDMVKGDDGYWTVTTKPLLPGFHYYAVAVDGFAANDPGKQSLFCCAKRSQRAGSSEFRFRILCHKKCATRHGAHGMVFLENKR